MGSPQRRLAFAAIFWIAMVLLVLGDWVRGASLHNRFDEPMPWALGSGIGSDKGAHCTAAPRK